MVPILGMIDECRSSVKLHQESLFDLSSALVRFKQPCTSGIGSLPGIAS